jgi:hypothetical protein
MMAMTVKTSEAAPTKPPNFVHQVCGGSFGPATQTGWVRPSAAMDYCLFDEVVDQPLDRGAYRAGRGAGYASDQIRTRTRGVLLSAMLIAASRWSGHRRSRAGRWRRGAQHRRGERGRLVGPVMPGSGQGVVAGWSPRQAGHGCTAGTDHRRPGRPRLGPATAVGHRHFDLVPHAPWFSAQGDGSPPPVASSRPDLS